MSARCAECQRLTWRHAVMIEQARMIEKRRRNGRTLPPSEADALRGWRDNAAAERRILDAHQRVTHAVTAVAS